MSDSLVQQHGGHGGIHAARQTHYHLVVADLLLKLGNCGVDERGGAPCAGASADVHHEVGQQFRAVGGMEHLGVELDAPGHLAADVVCGILHVLGRADYLVIGGHGGDGVAVAHPYLCGRGEAVHQRVLGSHDAEHGAAILAARSALDLTAVGVGQVLRAVAYAQQRQLALDLRQVGLRSVRVANRRRAARQYHSLHVRVNLRNLVEGMDLAIHVQLAHTARYELGVL